MADQGNSAASSPSVPSAQAAPATGQSTPTSTVSAPNPAAPKGDKNVFTELFGKESSQKSGNVLDAITTESEKKKKSAFFVDRSKSGKVSAKTLSKNAPRKRSRLGTYLLRFSVLAAFLSAAFFYTQNNVKLEIFRNNPAQTAIAAEELVELLNAQIHTQKHLASVLQLEQFMTTADAYFFNLSESESEFHSQNKQQDFADEAEELRPELVALVTGIQEGIADPMDSSAETRAKVVIDQEIRELGVSTADADRGITVQNIQDFESTKILVGSNEFKSFVLGLDPENLSDDSIQEMVDQYSKINRNVNTLIAEIKAERKPWSTYVDELEGIVKFIDPLFNTDFPGSLTVGTLVFNSSGNISIAGSSNTDDSKNFTVIANLVDALESSPRFEGVTQRSFSKSESGDDSYNGGYNITMQLTQDDE